MRCSMLVALAGLMMAGAAGVAGVVEQRICGVKPGERGHGANLLQHLHREQVGQLWHA